MSLPKNAVVELMSWLAVRLRFPHLFLLTAILFLADLLIPDLIPFLDEILLGLATLLLGSWRRSREPGRAPRPEPGEGPVIDVEPPRGGTGEAS